MKEEKTNSGCFKRVWDQLYRRSGGSYKGAGLDVYKQVEGSADLF